MICTSKSLSNFWGAYHKRGFIILIVQGARSNTFMRSSGELLG